MEQIDYAKVNEKIVEQAYASAQVLNEEQKRKLIRDKFERAAAYRAALQNLPVWHTDS
jgi:ribosomal protein L21